MLLDVGHRAVSSSQEMLDPHLCPPAIPPPAEDLSLSVWHGMHRSYRRPCRCGSVISAETLLHSLPVYPPELCCFGYAQDFPRRRRWCTECSLLRRKLLQASPTGLGQATAGKAAGTLWLGLCKPCRVGWIYSIEMNKEKGNSCFRLIGLVNLPERSAAEPLSTALQVLSRHVHAQAATLNFPSLDVLVYLWEVEVS